MRCPHWVGYNYRYRLVAGDYAAAVVKLPVEVVEANNSFLGSSNDLGFEQSIMKRHIFKNVKYSSLHVFLVRTITTSNRLIEL